MQNMAVIIFNGKIQIILQQIGSETMPQVPTQRKQKRVKPQMFFSNCFIERCYQNLCRLPPPRFFLLLLRLLFTFSTRTMCPQCSLLDLTSSYSQLHKMTVEKLLTFFLTYVLTFFLPYLLKFFLAVFMTFFRAYLLL